MWVDFPILNPYSSYMALPMWVQRGTMLQIPHESLMGCPYRTHINTHLWPMWVLYLLLAGFLFSIFCRVQDHRTFGFQWTHFALLKIIENRTEKNCIKPN